MSRANALAFIQALGIVLGLLSLVGAIEERDEIAKAERAQEARAVLATYADQAMGIVRLAAK